MRAHPPDSADFALWLEPQPCTGQLAGVVNALSEAESGSPSFVPHITLLHPIARSTPVSSIVNDLRRLVQEQGDLSGGIHVALEAAQSGSHYYQCVLAPVSPNDSLSRLRSSCEAAFDVHPPGPYFPHLSLLYGDISEERRRELAHVANTAHKLPTALLLGEILVVNCEGTAAEWKVVGRVSLDGSL